MKKKEVSDAFVFPLRLKLGVDGAGDLVDDRDR